MNTKRVWSKSIALVGTAVLYSGIAFAQTNGGSQSNAGAAQNNSHGSQRPMQDEINGQNGGQMGMQAAADKMFISKALMGGMAEVQMGQLAADKGTSEAVKNFGQKMVEDHTRMGDELKPVAKKLNVPIPTRLDGKEQGLYTKLQAMSGSEFDNAYVKAMVKDHKKDESEFKTEAANAADPDLKQVVTKGEQIISQHLQMIESIAKSSNVASK